MPVTRRDVGQQLDETATVRLVEDDANLAASVAESLRPSGVDAVDFSVYNDVDRPCGIGAPPSSNSSTSPWPMGST